MRDLYLVAHIAGTQVAICTQEVESVVSVGEVVPIPAAPRRVAGMFALRSRVVTLIDPTWMVSGKHSRAEEGATAIVAEVGGHVYGFVAEAVEDVVTIPTDWIREAGGIASGWSDLAVGVATMEDRTLLVVHLENFITAPRRLAA